jgi:O-antigen/teichoic acid export membrane protein
MHPPRITHIDDQVREDLRQTWRNISSYSVAGYALNNGDQYLIGIILGPASVGVYSLAYTLGGGLIALVSEPVMGVYGPRIFRAWSGGPDGPALAKRIAYRTTLLMAPATVLAVLGILVAGWLDLLHYITSAPNFETVALIITVASGFHAAAAGVLVNLLYLEKRTSYLSRAAWITVIVAVATLVGLTVPFGIVGAAWATLIAYVVLAALEWRYMRIPTAIT